MWRISFINEGVGLRIANYPPLTTLPHGVPFCDVAIQRKICYGIALAPPRLMPVRLHLLDEEDALAGRATGLANGGPLPVVEADVGQDVGLVPVGGAVGWRLRFWT